MVIKLRQNIQNARGQTQFYTNKLQENVIQLIIAILSTFSKWYCWWWCQISYGVNTINSPVSRGQWSNKLFAPQAFKWKGCRGHRSIIIIVLWSRQTVFSRVTYTCLKHKRQLRCMQTTSLLHIIPVRFGMVPGDATGELFCKFR